MPRSGYTQQTGDHTGYTAADGAPILGNGATVDMSFMDPDTGVNVVHGAALGALDPSERAARRKELLEQWEWDTLPYGAAARHLGF
ncbi:MAG: hypothetical protein HW418_2453 [Anaerolineales bacterium]|nr:hypothetical protein [Anaerolineales bacterium]